MILYRLCTSKYKNDISGNGSKIFGGRWNSQGIAVLYTTENISLAVLEILVRTDRANIPLSYTLLKISIPDAASQKMVPAARLNNLWEYDLAYTQKLGNDFLKTNDALMLRVPSAIVPEENNCLLNPRHPEYNKVKILTSSGFDFDKRLFLKNE